MDHTLERKPLQTILDQPHYVVAWSEETLTGQTWDEWHHAVGMSQMKEHVRKAYQSTGSYEDIAVFQILDILAADEIRELAEL